MPDLQSELAKINAAIKDLKFDDDEEETSVTTQQRKKLGTERIFEFIKAHPNSSAREIEDELKIDASSRVLDLVERGLVIRNRPSDQDPWRYTAVAQEYRTLSIEQRLEMARIARTNKKATKPSKSELAARKEKQREYNRQYREKMKALKNEATTHQPAAQVVNSIDELIDTLSLKQARELYEKLRAFFGG